MRFCALYSNSYFKPSNEADLIMRNPDYTVAPSLFGATAITTWVMIVGGLLLVFELGRGLNNPSEMTRTLIESTVFSSEGSRS